MNWGKKLVIGMAAFMLFIVTMGAVMILKNDNDALIEKDYYERGQNYNDDQRAKQLAVDEQMTPTVTIQDDGATIAFPVPVKYKLICRRPSDAKMDKVFAGNSEAEVRVGRDALQSGPWLLRIEFSARDKKYLFEDEIVMP